MMKLITAAVKELKLLAGDRPGLLVLFVMPAILVVVITLVQENIMRLTGQEQTEVLYLDLDRGPVGTSLAEQLSAAGLVIVAAPPERATIASVREVVIGGVYRVGMVVPAGTSDLFEQESLRLFRGLTGQGGDADTTRIALPVFYDPAVMASLRSGLSARIEAALTAITIERQLGRLQALMTGKTTDGNQLAELLDQPLFSLTEGTDAAPAQQYNPVQQNVPAWALFGMFFTAIPIGGGLLKERSSGIWLRLMSLPVSPLTLLGGKILAYLVICCCQFLLICLIGAILFPLFGLPAFTVSGGGAGVVVTVLLAGLAACAFGIVLGVICSSYEQASTLGATSVVVAAAVGGVMVPVYAMPPIMQSISIISPLNWGLTALHDILVRGAGLSAVWDNLGLLLAFTVLALGLACRLLPGRH